MTIWIDAQLSPALAAWVNRTYDDLQARSVRSLGLRDAEDAEIFRAAREAEVVVMSKDSDFLHLLDEHGPPSADHLGDRRKHVESPNAGDSKSGVAGCGRDVVGGRADG